MAITIHPKAGQILFCDFSQGFAKPEMVKRRPVVVLTNRQDKLASIVPLSTVEPNPAQLYHYKIPKQSLPMTNNFQEKDSWIKGDMIYTVGFHRLDLIRFGAKRSDGKREYYRRRLSGDEMKIIYRCVLHGLNLGNLGQYL